MRFLVCKKQYGEGCDYTIGCGMWYGWVDANSKQEAIHNVIFPDGKEEHSALLGDMALIEIFVIAEKDVQEVPVALFRDRAAKKEKSDVEKVIERRERLELQRLQDKFNEKRGTRGS